MSTFEIMIAVAIKLWPVWVAAVLTFLGLGIMESKERKNARHQRVMKNRKEYYTPKGASF